MQPLSRQSPQNAADVIAAAGARARSSAPDAPAGTTPRTRPSRALPDRPELNETTANALADQLYADGWIRLNELDPTERAAPNYQQAYEIKSFWTRLTRTGDNQNVRPEPWARKRGAVDINAAPRTALTDTLEGAGWLRASDTPANLVAGAAASPDWQTAQYNTGDNPATPYYDPQPEQWVRPTSTAAILEYNALALNDAGATLTDAAIIDETPQISTPEPVPAAPPATITRARAPKKSTTRARAPLNILSGTLNQSIARAAASLIPKIKITTTKPARAPTTKAAATIQSILQQQATTLATRAQTAITNQLISSAGKQLASQLITQAPAPVSVGIPSVDIAATAAAEASPITATATAEQAAEFFAGTSAPIDAATVIGAGATDAAAGLAGATAEQAATFFAGDAAAGVASAEAAAIAGTAAETTAAAAAQLTAIEGITAIAPPIAIAFAIFAIAKAAGLFGGGAGYAHTTGHEFIGTFGPAGFIGQVFGRSANANDQYRFALDPTPYEGTLTAQTLDTYNALNLAPAQIPINIIAGPLESQFPFSLIPIVLQYAVSIGKTIPPELIARLTQEAATRAAAVQAIEDARLLAETQRNLDAPPSDQGG